MLSQYQYQFVFEGLAEGDFACVPRLHFALAFHACCSASPLSASIPSALGGFAVTAPPPWTTPHRFCVYFAAYPEGTAREATEIQNLQLVDGDVTRQLGIPLYMLFPRLFTCPSTRCESFSVEFEVNVIVVFEDQYMVTENFPVVLVR